MHAIDEGRTGAAVRQTAWPIHPVAAFAFAGLLTIAWTCTIGLCAYDLACWLFN
jgi:hypothetical protein